MIKLIVSVTLILSLSVPVSALEIAAPEAPRAVADKMPEETQSFGDGLLSVARKSLQGIRPDLTEAVKVSMALLSAVLLVSILHIFSEQTKAIADIAGTITIAGLLLTTANSMIQLGTSTIQELSNYGKLLYPVMATAVAAQGGVSTSAALYVGTAVFNTVLGSVIANVMVPLVYFYLGLAIAKSALGESLLKKMADLIKNGMNWCLKTTLMIFTTYISITGVVSGTTDVAALKAAKVTISSVVPVVGGILSDASEAVLVSAGLIKNTAGIYGIFAILAVFLEPFLRIGFQYLLLKATAAICGLFSSRRISELIEYFSSSMGLLLAMTGAECMLLLISTFCFMKGLG